MKNLMICAVAVLSMLMVSCGNKNAKNAVAEEEVVVVETVECTDSCCAEKKECCGDSTKCCEKTEVVVAE